jgi:hypothetical protein
MERGVPSRSTLLDKRTKGETMQLGQGSQLNGVDMDAMQAAFQREQARSMEPDLTPGPGLVALLEEIYVQARRTGVLLDRAMAENSSLRARLAEYEQPEQDAEIADQAKNGATKAT